MSGVSAPGARKRVTTKFTPRTSRNISHILRGGQVAGGAPCGPCSGLRSADGGADRLSVGNLGHFMLVSPQVCTRSVSEPWPDRAASFGTMTHERARGMPETRPREWHPGAHRRIAVGTYGVCTKCGGEMHVASDRSQYASAKDRVGCQRELERRRVS